MVPPRTTVFVSYCRKNVRWLERLQIHLKPYATYGAIDLWDDTKIRPGAKWQQEISDAIDRASASILLISADFLASDFVAAHELPLLLHKAERAGALILPIYVEPVDLANHQRLATFQALNLPARPLAVVSRMAAERVLVKAVQAVGTVLAPAAGAGVRAPRSDGASDTVLFDQLQSATVTLSILWCLSSPAAASGHTIGELESCLSVRSRKRAFESVTDLVDKGWLAKARIAGATRYRLTPEGAVQWQRLLAATDGPLRCPRPRG